MNQKVSLPAGDIQHGFLQLDTAKFQFVIDQTMVDVHIKELCRQLFYCTSIFSYVQAYNAYLARFFSNHFDRPSYAYGGSHVGNMIDTFARIQKALFLGGSVDTIWESLHLKESASRSFLMVSSTDQFGWVD